MKRPEKIVRWFPVISHNHEPFVDHNGKPLLEYTIKLPYWIAKAYNPRYAKVEIRDKSISFADMEKEGNSEEVETYFKKNWLHKKRKLRKMNHNFLLVSTTEIAQDQFKSMQDYENYHKELRALNRKYFAVNRS